MVNVTKSDRWVTNLDNESEDLAFKITLLYAMECYFPEYQKEG